jgi:hypothetical protein
MAGMRRTALGIGLALTALIAAGTTVPAYAASPTDPATAISQQLAAGMSTDSPSYPALASSPGFHYVAATPANLQKAAATASASNAGAAAVTPNVSAGSCNYNGVADYPHVTNGEASVHGYWVVLSGTCPSTAKVTADLQALACSSLFGCTWITQDTRSGTYTPGSGTGHWATPHKTCGSTATVGWRGRVDVDLTNWSDPSGYQYSVERDLACYPAA